MNYLYTVAGIEPGPKTPEGVYARVVDGRTLYVNTTGEEKRIPITGTNKGIISNRLYEGAVVLGPQEMDLVPFN
jgi:beta-galactosidase